MLTLSAVKLDLGLQEQATDQDASLLSFIRQATALARDRTGRYLHCCCSGYAVANDVATVTAPAHGLTIGETVTLRNTGTNLNGERVITGTPTPHTFTFAFTSALTGTAATGSVHPRRVFRFPGNNRQTIYVPQEALPWVAVDELKLWLNNEWTTVDAEDYTATPDNYGRAATLELLDTTSFPRLATSFAGQFGRTVYNADDSVELTVDLGAEFLPGDLEMALLSIVAELNERQGGARDMQSVSIGGASRTSFTGTEKFEQRYSPDNVFLNWRACQ